MLTAAFGTLLATGSSACVGVVDGGWDRDTYVEEEAVLVLVWTSKWEIRDCQGLEGEYPAWRRDPSWKVGGCDTFRGGEPTR